MEDNKYWYVEVEFGEMNFRECLVSYLKMIQDKSTKEEIEIENKRSDL